MCLDLRFYKSQVFSFSIVFLLHGVKHRHFGRHGNNSSLLFNEIKKGIPRSRDLFFARKNKAKFKIKVIHQKFHRTSFAFNIFSKGDTLRLWRVIEIYENSPKISRVVLQIEVEIFFDDDVEIKKGLNVVLDVQQITLRVFLYRPIFLLGSLKMPNRKVSLANVFHARLIDALE